MKIRNAIYRAYAYVRHQVEAHNTLGYGIHSPYLFNIAREVLTCKYPYYAFSAIENQRSTLLSSRATIFVEDFGTGHSGMRQVSEIARRTLKPSAESQLLMRLAVMQQAKTMVELGTCLGISTAYLASANKGARVITFEGAAEVAKVARQGWQTLGLNHIECVVGNIDVTLPTYPLPETIDMAFLDANHTCEATLRYFQILLQHADSHSVFVLDDIHYSKDMERAWNTIIHLPEVTASMDLFVMGIVFFDTNLEKRCYQIRL